MSGSSPADYARISDVLAELDRDGFNTPAYDTVRRWANAGKIRAVRVGADRLLVYREDVRRMVTPTPVRAS
jgi:excisionase family DNA binding protein